LDSFSTKPGSPQGAIWGFARFGSGSGKAEVHRNPVNLFWPSVWTHRENTFAIDGYLSQADRLVPGQSTEDQMDVSSAFMKDSASWLRNIQNGCFNLVVHDQRKRRTLICSDQFGLLALYILRLPGGIWFASDLATLREISPVTLEIDPTGLAELYWFGYQLGDRTAYRRVEMVPAGSICSFSWEEGRETRNSWVETAPKPDGGRQVQTRDIPFQLRDLVESACDRLHMPSVNYGIKLSGGLDSRLIAGCWRHRPLYSYTWGDRLSAEVRLANRLADRLGFEHRGIPIQGGFFPRYYSRMFEQYGIMEFLHELATPLMLEDRVCLVLDGLLGDVFIGGGYFDDARKKSFPDLFRSAFGIRRAQLGFRCGNDEMARVLAMLIRVPDTDFPILEQGTKHKLDRLEDDIHHDISLLVERLRTEGDTFEFLVAKFLLLCRTRRYTALQGNTTRPEIQTLYPFIDTELARFLTSIPVEQFQYRDLYLRLYTEALPGIRDIPALRSNLPFYFPRRVHSIGRVVRGSLQRVGKKIFFVTGGKRNIFLMDGVQWERWLSENHRFREGIRNQLSESSVVDNKALDRTLSEVGRYRHSVVGTRLMLTVSFCRWYRPDD